MNLDLNKAKELYKIAEETLFYKNLTSFSKHKGELVKISDEYPGVWLEHSYDALLFSKLYPERLDVALSQVEIFFENQKEDGQLPCWIRCPEEIEYAGYGQIQECVSFANICFETYKLTENKAFLERAYNSLVKWDEWLCRNRMTRNMGLIETFCTYDTGHDNSLRFEELTNATPDGQGKEFIKLDYMPIISPDMNAVFYGDRKALSKMAQELALESDAKEWNKKAEEVKKTIFELLYDKDDEFFYDFGANGKHRKFKTILMATLFQEKLLDTVLFERIYSRYFKSEKHFNTKIPYPATSVSEPYFIQNLKGNSWNFYSQTLVALRSNLWMEHYGKEKDYEELLYKWLCAFTDSPVPFGQEFHPLTGEPSECSPNYSSALLFYINAMRRLGYIEM